MTDTDLKLKAINGLVHLHKTVKNTQPVDSPVTNFTETLYLHLLEKLQHDDPVAFTRFKETILSAGDISNQKDNEPIQDSSLLDVLLASEIKEISFHEDLEKEEVHIFMNLAAPKPKPVREEAALTEPSEENNQPAAYPDESELITLEKEQEIVPGTAVAEGQQAEEVSGEEDSVRPDKNMEITSEADAGDDSISESISRMEKVFTRLNAMEGAIESIPSADKINMMNELSMRAAEWIENETIYTPEYREICLRLQKLAQEFISNGFFSEATPIISVFSKVNSGLLQKDDKMRDVSQDVLQNLASDNSINVLFKEINSNERNKKAEACQVFAAFGNIVIGKLLIGLRNASDSKARISILHIIEEMGSAVIPAIQSSINMNAPWYYLRNMAYILGRIGNENSIDILKPLLLYKEKRVRTEAFKSIGLTGGSRRGPLLLSVLPQVDQELRVSIIEMLGKIKCAEAVADLQDMLKSKSSMAKGDLISLQEKICKALGAIGSPEAIKALSEVAESKSILGIGSYPKEVKYAAERALSYLRKK